MAGRKTYLSNVKIDAIYDIAKKNKYDTIIAQNFMIDTQSLGNWLQKGRNALEEQRDAIEEIVDLYLDNKFKVENIINNTINDYKEKFCEENNCQEINGKNKFFFNEYLRQVKEQMFEAICKENEEKIINATTFDEDEQENKKKQQYAKFFRGYSRGKMAITNFWQENIDKQSTNAKNVSLNLKGLELMHKDAYLPPKDAQVVEHKHSMSLSDMAKEFKRLQQQSEQNMIEDKTNVEIIEAEYEKE